MNEHEQLARHIMEHFPERNTIKICEESLKKSARAYPPSILIACMPRSGSTYLSNLLAAVTGYPRHPLVYTFYRNEQDLYLPALMKALTIPTVTQQHLRATGPTLELIDIFNLRPIVLVRNLFDVVVSYFDHLHQESLLVPAAYFPDEFLEFDDERKLDMIVDLVVPWYFSFYVSWKEAVRKGACSVAWLSYEDFIANRKITLRQILDYCGIPATDQEIERALDAVDVNDSRFNRGISGRGERRLNERQKQRIVRFARYYPRIDFSTIGIPPEAVRRNGADEKIPA